MIKSKKKENTLVKKEKNRWASWRKGSSSFFSSQLL